ncbi:hypothetical protein [Helicobacter pametensis]|uniref:hypothetical protein n=1 Tax=Helicobacter pametensis TaxID=95149 RepID=UPI0004801D24|nr:hypothetical protein [Helicobacter pametensis]
MYAQIKKSLRGSRLCTNLRDALGYSSLGDFRLACTQFEKYERLREWLESGYEDEINNALMFYCKMLEYFGFEWDEVNNEMNECKELLDSRGYFARTLFVETELNPKSNACFSTISASEISILKQVSVDAHRFDGKTLNEILSEYGVIIRKHYRENEGFLWDCGDILGYRADVLGKMCRFNTAGVFERFLKNGNWIEDHRSLFERVKHRVQNTSHNQTAEQLGFSEFWRFKKGAEILSECESLEEWIGRGFYGLGMRAGEFFVRLASVFFDEREEAEELVKKCRSLSRRCECFDGVIFVITQKRAKDFVEFTSDYGVGILNEMREIYIDRRVFRQKTRYEILEWLKRQIKSHFVRNDGRLGIWGEIKGYAIRMYGMVYEFDTQGRLVCEREPRKHKKIKGLTQGVKEIRSAF